MIVLPFPPSVNHTHVTTRQGRRVPTKVYRDYMAEAAAFIKAGDYGFFEKVESITYYLYWPSLRRSDQDNRLKATRDSLVGNVIADDCWTCVPEEHIYSFLDRDNPRIEIEIRPAVE